jgi:hypothetical protein
MSVKLTIEIAGPLDAEDRDLLSGVAVMTLAIANHEMAKHAFPEAFPDPEEETAEEPAAAPKRVRKATPKPPSEVPCAFVSPDDPTMICVGHAGHRGRHKFRQIPLDPTALSN